MNYTMKEWWASLSLPIKIAFVIGILWTSFCIIVGVRVGLWLLEKL